MNSKETAKSLIPQWKKILLDEHKEVREIHRGVHTHIHQFAADVQVTPPCPGVWVSRHRSFIQELHKFAGRLEDLIEAQHVRANTLAVYYDMAQKEQGSVLDIYEKLEECIEILRSELKDVTKKMYSFSTLEMEYYEKLLQVYDSSNTEDPKFKRDYDDMRTTLDRIYRNDQYYIAVLQLDTMFASIDNTQHKFVAILDSNEHTIQKMYDGNSSMMMV